ncbi:unnamed protein product [Gongylonema pulchrum]|uniref:TPR_REGION domain-containing protein n=1 Tax=Gongylonema pulchrum TaxID=637853 RepID=A0A183CVL9_9BILA|nr:unnamed protein product [Gongylonema pulchrum]
MDGEKQATDGGVLLLLLFFGLKRLDSEFAGLSSRSVGVAFFVVGWIGELERASFGYWWTERVLVIVDLKSCWLLLDWKIVECGKCTYIKASLMEDFEETPGNKPLRLPKKAARVKNKAPADLQITAEQLLREAKERDLEIVAPPPKTKISDPEELAEYQRKRRKEFEDNIRKNRSQIANWVKYAKWEENIGELQRARSVFERALSMDHRSITLYLQYAEMEMRLVFLPFFGPFFAYPALSCNFLTL